ncbi:sensor domain-containing protein [Kitasatospora sp. NPDC002227]|uniref:sensor domain-containing protein n=1 Tax=Kitasatospora sp. NPDC002227 TaxID=3154773 RepID=UPI003317B378
MSTTQPSTALFDTSQYPYRRRPAPSFLQAPFAGATYRELGFVLTAFPIATAAFVLAITGLSVGAGLLVTVVGLPVLGLLLASARGFGAMERLRARTLLDMDVPAPAPVRPSRPGFWGAVTARLADGTGWRAVIYQLVMFPYAVFAFVTATVVLSVGWAAALYPAYHWAIARWTPWPGLQLFDFSNGSGEHRYYLSSPWQIAGFSAFGLLLVFLSPLLIRALTSVHRLAVRVLLGAL